MARLPVIDFIINLNKPRWKANDLTSTFTKYLEN